MADPSASASSQQGPNLHHEPSQSHTSRQHHHHQGDILITPALPTDADPITDLITAAYTKYVPRMPTSTPPAPMLTDYAALIASQARDDEIHVLRDNTSPDRNVVGAILLSDSPSDASVKVHNLVVAPSAQGKGYGRRLMDFAERVARGRGRPALTLFTNEVMWENLAVYAKMGFVEVDRRVEDGYRRVYFRKELAPA